MNNAQSIIDEFVASAWAKWGLPSGLVLLLPHGYEGQGPNHSNAHLERFLQLAAEDNLRVIYPSTAAQYFHALREQADSLNTSPRPLIVMTGKSLLRHPLASVDARELTEGAFQAVLDDARAAKQRSSIRRVVFCSGKVALDLIGSEAYANAADIAVLRIEGVYPFPAERVASALKQYRNAREVVWVQEEPRNRGAWTFIEPRIRALLDGDTRLLYVGRPDWPSPAEGSPAQHRANQAEIVRRAFAEVEENEAPASLERPMREVTHVR